jgi:hypothetical protein
MTNFGKPPERRLLLSTVILLISAALAAPVAAQAAQIAPRGPMTFAAGLGQGLYYSSIPEYSLHALQYDGEIELFMGGYLPRPGLVIGGTIGLQMLPPPAASEYFSYRGLWGLRTALSAEYLFTRFSLGLALGADFFRYWNTRVLIMTPEIRLFGGIPLASFPVGEYRGSLILVPRAYLHLRRDSAFSAGLGTSVVLRL